MKISGGYVYVIREDRTGLYKIGLTRHLGQRLRQLKVGRTATLVHHCHYSNPEAVELYLHRLHARHRIPQTEYFQLAEPPVLPGATVKTSTTYSYTKSDISQTPVTTQTQAPANPEYTSSSSSSGCLPVIFWAMTLMGIVHACGTTAQRPVPVPVTQAPPAYVQGPAPAPVAAKPTPKPEAPQQPATGEEGTPASAYKDSAPQTTQEPPPVPAVPAARPGSYGQVPPPPPTPTPQPTPIFYITPEIAETYNAQETRMENLGKEYNNAYDEMDAELACTLAQRLATETDTTIKLYTRLLEYNIEPEQRSFATRRLQFFNSNLTTINASIAACKSKNSV